MPKHAQESSLLLAGLELQSERTPVDIASFTIEGAGKRSLPAAVGSGRMWLRT